MIRPRSRRAPVLSAWVSVLVCALTLTVLTGCSSGGSDAPSASPSASGSAPTAINAQPRSVLAAGGELRIPVDSFPTQWNPLHTDGASAQTQLIMSTLLPQLFSYDGGGNPAPNPDYLAAVNASGDNPQVVTYTLNPNAAWAGGRALDASDFIADWKACNGQNVSFHCADTKKYAEVASVKQGANPQQVIVTYRGAYDAWPSTFQFLLPREAVTDPATFNEGWTSITKIAEWLAGPFRVGTLDTRAGVLTEPANPAWWGDKPMLSQVTFRAVPGRDQLQALQDNRIDIADVSADSSAAGRVAQLPDCELRRAEVPGGKRQSVVVRRTLANFGAFGRSSIDWPDVGYLPPSS
jgi:peptide/nickel transport system substrate-binding protein